MPAATFARRLAAVLAVAGVVAGCSSGGRVSPSGSSPIVVATTTAPVVTDAPTTTQVPTEATPLVRQAVLDYWAAQQRCQQRPQVCRPASFTADQGGARADVEAALTTLLTNGWYRGASADGNDAADGGYVVVGAVTIGDDATTATADECVYDPTPLMGPGGVVNADAVPRRFVHTLYLEGGTWKVGDEQVDTSGACANTPDTVFVDTTT